MMMVISVGQDVPLMFSPFLATQVFPEKGIDLYVCLKFERMILHSLFSE